MQCYLIEYGNHIKMRYLYLLLISDVISNHTGTSALVIVWMIQVQRGEKEKEKERERERERGDYTIQLNE